ncbi:MAG: hypothetical protein H0V63_12460 [Burkholderiaceae bacterium]|nr:hypothetical protein [Burkholderiaceae bacterium]
MTGRGSKVLLKVAAAAFGALMATQLNETLSSAGPSLQFTQLSNAVVAAMNQGCISLKDDGFSKSVTNV